MRGEAYPNIHRWFDPLLRRLRKLGAGEYVALVWELSRAKQEEQYRRDLALLDDHLGLAAKCCANFDRLISERSRPGKDLHGANRMVLDKLAEIRAIVGLQSLGFEDITHQGTPDLTVTQGHDTLAVEVTRLAASSKQVSRPTVSLLAQGDGSEEDLASEIFNKVQAKQDQLTRLSPPFARHVIWISLGRDYFTAGLYERGLTGLRRKMSGYDSDALHLAVSRVRSELNYQELKKIVLCLGREEPNIVAPVK